MSSTYLALYYHLIFSTAERQSSIEPEWRPRLHEYLGGTVNQLGGQSLGVGGTNDHVHLIVQLHATHCLADFMRELKKASSSWVRGEIPCGSFAWQKGYAALTVSASIVPKVQSYIEGQENHHRKIGFREEVLTLLRRSGVEVNEKNFD
jgi:REP element-mobilizing transposase RayT